MQKMTHAHSTMVAPDAVSAHGWAEIRRPDIPEHTPIMMEIQNIMPELFDKLRAEATGTIKSAVTRSTPADFTEKITTSDNSATYTY